MVKAYAFMANGTEEVELLAVVDLLRRAGAEVALASVDGEYITSSHGVRLGADVVVDESTDFSDADLLFVPGGMPGAKLLGESRIVVKAIDTALKNGKRVAAICAAPSLVLGENGFLTGKRGVCFPGFESGMKGCDVVSNARVVTDGSITTARGLGCAIDLGLELIRLIFGADKAAEIENKIQYR